jgi:hypothetical protein
VAVGATAYVWSCTPKARSIAAGLPLTCNCAVALRVTVRPAAWKCCVTAAIDAALGAKRASNCCVVRNW